MRSNESIGPEGVTAQELADALSSFALKLRTGGPCAVIATAELRHLGIQIEVRSRRAGHLLTAQHLLPWSDLLHMREGPAALLDRVLEDVLHQVGAR